MTTEPWASVEDVAKQRGVAKDAVYRWIGARSDDEAHDSTAKGDAR